MRIDYHTHHNRCGHAQGTLRDMIQAAIEMGIDQLGLSDHSPHFFREQEHFDPRSAMARSEFPNYIAECVALRDEFAGQIDIRIGVESDYIAGWAERYHQIYNQFSLDYIIGSVHLFDGHHVYSRQRWEEPGADPDEIYKAYFRHVQESTRYAHCWDIIGHCDAVKALKRRPNGDLTAVLDETAQAIARSGLTVELNTSGMRKCQEVFPSPDMVARLHRLGVTFTFGSDAHSPQELMHEWEHVLDLLKQVGVREMATFKGRRRTLVPIPF